MNMDIRLCTQEVLGILPDFSRRTYFETFAEQNTPENMAAYLEQSLWDGKAAGRAGEQRFRVLLPVLRRNAGRLSKVERGSGPNGSSRLPFLGDRADLCGKGISGKRFGASPDDVCHFRSHAAKKSVCLAGSVGEKRKGPRLLSKEWLLQIGTHTFVMGDDPQTDYIMRKDLKR